MPVKMSDKQLEFWQELLAPFAEHELSEVPARGGQGKLTYIDKRALENRLDSVCGPTGWFPEYEATQRGYKCRLWILCPAFSPADVWTWHYKEDGAGFEEMGKFNKQTQEFEVEVDNDEKSGYTNALRRAAQDAWGIGRYLYRKGIPTFLDPNARAPERPKAPTPPPCASSPSAPPAELRDRETPPASTREQPKSPPAQSAPTSYGNSQPAQGHGNFKLPPAGKPVFAWTKEMEKVFQTKLVDGMGQEGERRGWGKQFADWDQNQANEICKNAIHFLMTLPTYKGQFDYMFADKVAPGGPAANPPGHGINIADLRRDLSTKIQALLHRQFGRAAEKSELAQAFKNISHECVNSGGTNGEVCESLARCNDIAWLSNMIVFVNEQIERAASSGEAPSDDIPF